jgi:hypothetical protein
LDLIYIKWRLPPKSFRVYYKLDPNGEFIPATEVHTKNECVTDEGKKANEEAKSYEDSVIFHKPIFARVIHIALNSPLEKHSFSIWKVHFYVKQGCQMIKNESIGKPMCFYVNTDKPKVGTPVEAYGTVEAVSCGKNSELFVYYNDRAIVHKNSKLCVGFDRPGGLVLQHYDEHKPAYTVQFHHDGSMFFDGYSEDCITIDDEKKTSPNFINDQTPILCTSEADNSTLKKENIKCN